MDSLTDPLMSANFTLWIVITVLILFIAFKAFRSTTIVTESTTDDSQKKTLRMWGYFFIILAISNILILTWRFAITDVLVSDIIERTANTLFYFACFMKVVDIEKGLIQAKWYRTYYFSAVMFITILINVFVSPAFLKVISAWQVAFLIMGTIGFSVFPIIYFYVSRKSTGKVRSNALKVSAGAVFLAIGYLFRPENVSAYYGLSPLIDLAINCFYITAPIVIVIGVVLIYDSFAKLE